MVYRVYVEKKKELANEAKSLLNDARSLLNIKELVDVRVINRYDADHITEELFDYACKTVFSEPQLDIVSTEIVLGDATGQFDQRADSAAQCIQIISQGERPVIRAAKVYALYGNLNDAQIDEIKKYVINPVESREATLEKPETLNMEYDIPTEVKILAGFTKLDKNGLTDFISESLSLLLKTVWLDF